MKIKINMITDPGVQQEADIILFACIELEEYLNKIFRLTDENSTLEITLATGEKLRYDGYLIDIKGTTVCIKSELARGVLQGVYEFLRMLGCSFLFPGKERQYIPSLEAFPLKDQIVRREPWIEFRGLCLYNTTAKTLKETTDAIDWMIKNGYNFLLTSINRLDDTGQGDHAILWTEIEKEVFPEIRKRGIVIDMSEHSTDYYFPRKTLYKKHPEWFSLIRGKRLPLQICYSNEEAVQAYAEGIVNFVKDKREFQFFGIWPLDGGGYCECDKCKDPHTLLRANMYIAKEIAKVRPDLTVEHLAYTPQSFACPEENLPDNMSVLVCNERGRIACEWGRKARKSGGAFFFEYLTADHYRFRSNVLINPIYIKDTINTLAAYGYRGIVSLYLPVTCWWQASINYWYMSQLYYNPTADIKDLTSLLALQLFGAEKQETMSNLLLDIYYNLQDKSMWNSSMHGHDWFEETICGRNTKLDELHLQRFEEVYQRIKSTIEEEERTAVNPSIQRQFRLLKHYVNLQWLYFTGVNLYNADKDTKQRAEPYFAELAKLEMEQDNPFISEKYARWRITGRDNIFIPNASNGYEAHS